LWLVLSGSPYRSSPTAQPKLVGRIPYSSCSSPVSLPFKAARHHRTMQDGGWKKPPKKLFFGQFLPRKNRYFSPFGKIFFCLLVY